MRMGALMTNTQSTKLQYTMGLSSSSTSTAWLGFYYDEGADTSKRKFLKVMSSTRSIIRLLQ